MFGFGLSGRRVGFHGSNGVDVTSISGCTLWLDATDVTASSIVTAMNNKVGTDPTINATEEPLYTASNANYNRRPTWKCNTAATKVITASAACHGMTAGPYTVVIVGQCGDANYAMGAPSGGTLIAGGGGSGDKWQLTSDAGTYLVSTGLANTPSVLIGIFNNASSKIYANSQTAVSGPAGTLENMTSSSLNIGNYGAPAAALGANGDTTHFIIYNRALTQAECAWLEVQLGAESGITISP